METKKVVKKTLSIAGNVILYLFIAICLFGVVVTVLSKSDTDGTATIFGMQMRTVLTSSMEECDQTDVSEYEIGSIPVHSVVFIETVPTDKAEADAWYADLKVGDVLTFKYVFNGLKQETITHRIVRINPNANGGYTILLEGDNKSEGTDVITQEIDTSEDDGDYVIGKVVGTSYLVGLFITALKSPVGIVCIVILPAFVILLLEVIKVIRLLTADKKKQERKEREEQQEELEMLRRRLAELEKASNPNADSPPQKEDRSNENNGEEP